jgi:hypothetical protein
MTYNHLYQQIPDNYVDVIGSTGGTLFFKSQGNQGRAISYNGSGNIYRSIHSAVVFGALRNGSDTKTELMDIYMIYLSEILSVEEVSNEYISNITVVPNPARKNVNVKFNMVQPGHVKVTIYNIAGQKVRQLADRSMATGTHTLIWYGRDDMGRNLSSGNYIVEIETASERINKVIVFVK